MHVTGRTNRGSDTRSESPLRLLSKRTHYPLAHLIVASMTLLWCSTSSSTSRTPSSCDLDTIAVPRYVAPWPRQQSGSSSGVADVLLRSAHQEHQQQNEVANAHCTPANARAERRPLPAALQQPSCRTSTVAKADHVCFGPGHTPLFNCTWVALEAGWGGAGGGGGEVVWQCNLRVVS